MEREKNMKVGEVEDNTHAEDQNWKKSMYENLNTNDVKDVTGCFSMVLPDALFAAFSKSISIKSIKSGIKTSAYGWVHYDWTCIWALKS
jgi:hypothetical protein